jgi:hypothetical protein
MSFKNKFQLFAKSISVFPTSNLRDKYVESNKNSANANIIKCINQKFKIKKNGENQKCIYILTTKLNLDSKIC